MQVGIIGVTGYTGVELVRLLAQHPEVEVGMMAASTAGDLAQEYPHLAGLVQKTEIIAEKDGDWSKCEVIFTATPHGKGMSMVPELLDSGVKVIDLGGDFRYRSAETYRQWYQLEHTAPALLLEAEYGLSELNAERIRQARLIANPGCYPTASLLGISPLLRAGLVDNRRIIVDAKSGVTGAGKSPTRKTHFSEVDENFRAYSPAVHRHTSEIEEQLSMIASEEIQISFTPHLLPIKRGILATIYLDLLQPITEAEIYAIYQDSYRDKPFMRIRKPGDLPEISHVAGSNYCDIGFVVDERLQRVVVVSVIDNLVKGASGQAVQNLNLLMGLAETTGLTQIPMYL